MTRILLSLAALAALLMTAAPSEAWAQLNQPPVANPDAATVLAGDLLRLDVLRNDTDADGDTLRILSIDAPPKKGEAAIVDTADTSQRILYRSNANATGVDSLVYRIDDGNGGQDEAVVRITLISNRPPVAADDSATVFATAITEIDVLANDSDPDGDLVHIDGLAAQPRHGTATITDSTAAIPKQLIRYDPDDAFAGLDSLLYIITDPRGNRDTATVRITVVQNQRPVAANDEVIIFINTITDIDVLDNDTDAEDDSLFILSIPDPPDHGSVEIINDGRAIRYTPRTGYLGDDQFVYGITDRVERDGSLEADRATVFIQVLPPNEAFVANLSGGSVTPPVQTQAFGQVTATLDGNVLRFTGSFARLRSPLLAQNGARGMAGPAGRNGEPVFTLTPTLTSDRINGDFADTQNTFVLTEEQADALFSRRLYIVLRTQDKPAGEIRGQLLPSGASAFYRAVFSGRAAVPFTASTALGGVVAERFDNTLTITGSFEGLASDFFPTAEGARLQQGSIGVSGDVLFDLDVDLDGDRRGGQFRQQANEFVLTNDQIQLLDNGRAHLVIRTRNAGEGEIRGQLLPLTAQVYETILAGSNEAPPVATRGTGAALATLDGLTFALSGTFSNLASPVDLTIRNGAHIHEAPPGENGPILVELGPVLDPLDQRNGSFPDGANTFVLTSAEQEALFDGLLYVNVHTQNTPTGEVRGQLLPSPNIAPAPSTIAAPADGAMVDLSGDPSAPFFVVWGEASDINGNTVYYRWQLAQDAGFGSVIYATDLMQETALESTSGMIDTALANAGIDPNATITLFHRIVTTDGALATDGPAAQVTVTRGTATDVEEIAVPERFAVLGNYPNPFNPTTTVRVDLPQPARVQVAVFDVLGRRVLTTTPRDLEAGAARAVSVDAGALASGLYVYRVIARSATETFVGSGRMTVVK